MRALNRHLVHLGIVLAGRLGGSLGKLLAEIGRRVHGLRHLRGRRHERVADAGALVLAGPAAVARGLRLLRDEWLRRRARELVLPPPTEQEKGQQADQCQSG